MYTNHHTEIDRTANKFLVNFSLVVSACDVLNVICFFLDVVHF